MSKTPNQQKISDLATLSTCARRCMEAFDNALDKECRGYEASIQLAITEYRQLGALLNVYAQKHGR